VTGKSLPILILVLLITLLPITSMGQSKNNFLLTDNDDDMDLGEGFTKKATGMTPEEKALRLRKMVVSATKGETTVQEAPAVITIITEDDIKDYGFRNFMDLMDFIPSVMTANGQYGNMPLITSLGNSLSILLIQDGISMFDPVYNIQASMRRWPMEMIKRVESMSSPGGVLWGANAFMGITSIVTKSADDVDGVQLGLGAGTGPGDQDVLRAYAMFGKTFNKFKVFAHLSGEFYRGPKYEYLPVRFMMAPPSPMGTIIYSSDEENSGSNSMNFYGTFNGKIDYKKFQLIWSYPFTGLPGFKKGLSNPTTLLAWNINTSSPLSTLRTNNFNFIDRMVALKYKDSTAKGKVGVDAKIYFTEFVREMSPFMILPYTQGSLAGLAFDTTSKSYRTGISLDFNYNFSKQTRLLFGAETFYEWIKDSYTRAIAPVDANGMTDFSSLPMSCPYNGAPVYDPLNPENTTFVPGCRQNMVFDQDRLVMGIFSSIQHKFKNKVIADAGLRIQAAPAGNVSYSTQVIPGASVVVPLVKNWFWKANYLRGFRPPGFNNTGGNGRAVTFSGFPEIQVEKSQAFQTEINGILIKNKGKIQELTFRLNYAYSILDNVIKINQGQYFNSPSKTIHSMEFLARLYLRGGHNVFLGYSFNTNINSDYLDGMIMRSIPNQWFSLGTVFRITKKMDFITTLKIMGAFEDPNRVINSNNESPASFVALEMVPSGGLLSAGIRYKTTIANHKAEFSLMTYNLTDTKSYYSADYFNDLAASTETVPTKSTRFYFLANSKFYF
jgi:outer membrane receptor protein involved in Fe transport